jgi:hypothetical protein
MSAPRSLACAVHRGDISAAPPTPHPLSHLCLQRPGGVLLVSEDAPDLKIGGSCGS